MDDTAIFGTVWDRDSSNSSTRKRISKQCRACAHRRESVYAGVSMSCVKSSEGKVTYQWGRCPEFTSGKEVPRG